MKFSLNQTMSDFGPCVDGTPLARVFFGVDPFAGWAAMCPAFRCDLVMRRWP